MQAQSQQSSPEEEPVGAALSPLCLGTNGISTGSRDEADLGCAPALLAISGFGKGSVQEAETPPKIQLDALGQHRKGWRGPSFAWWMQGMKISWKSGGVLDIRRNFVTDRVVKHSAGLLREVCSAQEVAPGGDTQGDKVGMGTAGTP